MNAAGRDPVSGEALAALLPQQGAMRLLDAIVSWDMESIVCESVRHAEPNHALAVGGRLSPLIGIELAAQAIAAHAALADVDRAPRHGFLARVRDCTVHCERIDRLPKPIRIEAHRIAATPDALSYRFLVSTDAAPVLDGSVLIALSGNRA